MLEAHDVTVRLARRNLLAGVTLAVAPGEMVAVLGENGTGKTTLLRVLAGDRLPARAKIGGEVLLAGRRIHDWPLAERARLRAVLPQRPELAFAFTAAEVAAFGRYPASSGWLRADDHAIALRSLELTDAAHLADRDVTTLSGGEVARVHLAAAFAQLWETQCDRPRFLLLDEPTAALDLAHQHHLLATARDFARSRGIGIVAILHDLNLAASYAGRVVILCRGEVLAHGTPRTVLDAATIATGFAVQACVLAHPLNDCALIATAAMRRPVAAHCE